MDTQEATKVRETLLAGGIVDHATLLRAARAIVGQQMRPTRTSQLREIVLTGTDTGYRD